MAKLRVLAVGVLCPLVGCFSPSAPVETESGDVNDTTTEVSSGTSVVDPETSSGESTSDPSGPPTTASDPETTEAPSTDDTTSSSTALGETGDPFCGDGNIDPGEECDDGLRDNALDGACLPDCNLNVCGDGNVGPDEGCDEGADDNVFEVGACAPDCSRVIEEKEIVTSTGVDNGYLQPNPVGLADGLCPVGHRALFAVPGVRQATNGTPRTADNQIDWPLRPYTAYVNNTGDLIWMTDDVPLLGVRDGEGQPLENPVIFVGNCQTRGVLTGLNDDWTNALDNTCNGWSSTSSDLDANLGQPCLTEDFLDNDAFSCASLTPLSFFYCVEQ